MSGWITSFSAVSMTRMFSLRLWLTLYDRPRVLDMDSNFSVQCTMILDVRTRVKLSKSLIPFSKFDWGQRSCAYLFLPWIVGLLSCLMRQMGVKLTVFWWKWHIFSPERLNPVVSVDESHRDAGSRSDPGTTLITLSRQGYSVRWATHFGSEADF